MTIKDVIATIADQPKPLQDVTKIDITVLEVCRDMLETMQANTMEFITAADIGSPYRIIAVDGNIDNMSETLGVVILINPNIAVNQEDFVVVEFNDITGANQSLILVENLKDIALAAIQELTQND